MSKSVKPYYKDNQSKKEEVAEMFNNISKRYDFLNHFLSMGIDNLWRKKAIKILGENNPKVILDIATGTGDFAVEALKLKPTKVIGIDISQGMLDVGIEKMKKKSVDHIIELQLEDSENLSFEDNYFDGYTIGFGIRNFEHVEKSLTEMLRVLKPNGKAVILEFSKPKKFPIKHLFHMYSKYILPKIGKLVSKDARAYTYLPESIDAFPEGEAFMSLMKKAGYKDVNSKLVSGGIATIYYGNK
jgi:demethylmenaquinone methyltransferase/2-methoxy-6-polyprenyl-1,4-benzoquinol methylase